MQLSIRTKRMYLTPDIRQNIGAFIRQVFWRERHRVTRTFVSLGITNSEGDLLFTCRISFWSSYLGLVTVSDVGDTILTAVQQASLRARQVVRRRLNKRRSLLRRSSNRLRSWLPNLAQSA